VVRTLSVDFYDRGKYYFEIMDKGYKAIEQLIKIASADLHFYDSLEKKEKKFEYESPGIFSERLKGDYKNLETITEQ
jgi:HJR/Mrr/RecB family endonuclease